MKMKRIWWGFLMIAAVAFLAGCGGGGGGGTSLMVGGERATQSAIDALAASLATAEAARATATTELETATMNAEGLRMMLATADETIADLNMQIMNADEETVAMLRTDLAAEMARAEGLEMMLTDAQADVMRLTGALATANEDLADFRAQEAKDADAAASVNAEGLLDALVSRSGENLNAMTTVTTLTAKRTAADGVTVLLNANTATPPKSPYSPSTAHAGASPDIADLHKVVLDRNNIAAKTTDIIAVYTDIDMPTDQRLVEVEGGAKNKNVFVVFDESENVDKSLYIQLSAADTMKIELQHSGGVEEPDLTLSQGGTTTTTFSGNYKGVPGTFTCATAGCTPIVATAVLDDTALDYNKDGTLKVTLAGFATVDTANDWYFEPGNPAVTTSVQDADYLYFGWWHILPQKPGERNDRNDHGVNVFFGGSQPFTTGEEDNGGRTFMQLVEGDATYSGSATGKYVQEGGPRANPDFTGDAFTATATLTASFGDGDNVDDATSDNDDGLGTIEGSITGFVNGQGEVLDGWKVTLNPIALVADANTFATLPTIDPANDDNAVAEIAGGESDMGIWSGRFFGNNREDGQPGSVAGKFETYFGAAIPAENPNDVHTAIHGAFGATNTSPDE